MTTDLREMTALDLLRAEAAREDRYGAGGLLAFHMAGVDDLDMIYKPRPDHDDPAELLTGVLLLTKNAARRIDPPLTDADLDALPIVGAKVYAEDRENAADWLAAAHRWLEVRTQFGSHHVSGRTPRTVLTPFLAAGRGPAYVRRVIDAAGQYLIAPDAYGYDLTADEWVTLASAGIPDRHALGGYEVAGCSLPEAVDMAVKGVPAGAAVLLHREGVPMASWVELAAGIKPEWVPFGIEPDGFHDDGKRPRDPAIDGVIGKAGGHTLADLKRYADAGWTTGLYSFGDRGMRYGNGRRGVGTLTAKVCNRLVDAGLTPEDLARWANAITTSSSGSRDDRDFVPALCSHYWKPELLDDVIRLHEAGVRPSHINDYRYAGCKSTDDVLRCVEVGITGTRCAYLRKTYANRKNRWDKDRLTLQQLLDAHETDQREAAS